MSIVPDNLLCFLMSVTVKFPCPPYRQFRCRNDRVCLSTSRVCDGIDNCGDGTDEENCGEWKSCFPETCRVVANPILKDA